MGANEERRYSSWLLERLTIGDVHRLRLGTSTIGRKSTSAIRITDSSYVSRNHAKVVVADDDLSVEIEDLQSVNGIFVNEVQNRQAKVALKDGDQIGIGVLIDNEINSADPEHPVYVLKYAPLRRVLPFNERPCPLSVSVNRGKQAVAKPIATINPVINTKHIGTASLPTPTTTTTCKFYDCITISDDEDDVDHKNVDNRVNSQISTTPPSAVVVKTEKQCEHPHPIDLNQPCTSAEAIAALGAQQNAQSKSPMQNELAKTHATAHMPIISSLKQERVRSVSNDIQCIFGDADDIILDKMKNINPYVYNNLNVNATPGDDALVAGDCIDLMSDDEFGVVTPITAVNTTAAKSPNIFEESLNESKEAADKEQPVKENATKMTLVGEHATIEDVHIKTEINTNNASSINERLDMAGEPTCCELLSDDENGEEFMFSQMVINDMKAELADENIDDFVADLEKVVDEIKLSEAFPQEQLTASDEPVATSTTKAIKTELDESVWSINDDVDDDNDYDEELENKVSDWSAKLFSQSFSQANMSQVYEVEDDENVDEERPEDREDDYELDFYNRLGDDIEDFMDDLYTSLKDKVKVTDVETTAAATTDAEEVMPAAAVTSAQLDSPVLKKAAKRAKRVLSSSDEDEDIADVITEMEPSVNELDRNIEVDTKAKEVHAAEEEITADENKVKEKIENKSKPEKSKPEKSKPENQRESASPPKEQSTKRDKDARTHKRKLSTKDSNRANQDIASASSLTAADIVEQPHKLAADLNDITEPQSADLFATKAAATNITNDRTKAARGPPKIISAPHLPKHKGKLRGVSAEPVSTVKEKLASVRDNIRSEKYSKELKQKWLEKPSVAKKRDKERVKVLKESRKELLKKIADKQHVAEDDRTATGKRKLQNDESHEDSKKKPKVKVTSVNRGAFLTKEAEKAYKIPKKPKSDQAGTAKDATECADITTATTSALSLENAINAAITTAKTNQDKRSTSIDSFAQILNKPDALLLKRQNSSDASAATTTQQISPTGQRKESIAARAMRTTNKITFASMQRNFVESHQNQKKLDNIANTHTCMTDTVARDKDVGRKKKQVRFNDTPMIHYIDRICGANKKVDKKDATVCPQSTITERRHRTRQAFPIVDCTSKIISMILGWSIDWLEKRSADVQAAGDLIMPMANQFNSFDNYKSVLFPLMKLEFLSQLEREYKKCHMKQFKVSLEYVTNTEDRFMLITKYNTPNINASKCDLVVLYFNEKHNGTFAYVSANRRGSGSSSTFVFEILSKNFTKNYLSCIKEIKVRPVVDNIRVEFGAFNAVYQLESTPLFQKIINPLELLKCRSISKEKIRYKGFDILNDKQRLIVLNTYAKIKDENTPTITLIKGPPGTGKSSVITNLALQTMYGNDARYMDKKILICAQSNGAVDVIAARLYDVQKRMSRDQFKVIRYGMPDKINPQVAKITLQKIIEAEQLKKLAAQNVIHGNNKENLKNEMLMLESHILEMQKRNIQGTVEEEELIANQKKLKLMRNIINQSMRPEDERSIYSWHLTNADIVCTTLSSCVKLSQYVNYFDVCIIDEATQCTEPWTLLPLKFGIHSLVLVGDTQQLPATVLSKKAVDLGLGNSMFTRIQRCLETVHTGIELEGVICSLQTQYRMHPDICRWPNLYFYKNELINAPSTHKWTSPITPFSILNLAYSQNEHCNNGKISNNLEAEFVVNLLKALDGYIPNKYNSYGVITPYAEHRQMLEASIKSSGLSNIMVNTIDSYQGLEKDVIVISNARTHGIGFLANHQRLNVALTRPRKCLILCGNFKNLESVPSWRSLLNNARERKLFHEISATNALDVHRNVIEKIKIKH